MLSLYSFPSLEWRTTRIKEFTEETIVLYERLVLDIAAPLREDYRFRMQSTVYLAFVLKTM